MRRLERLAIIVLVGWILLYLSYFTRPLYWDSLVDGLDSRWASHAWDSYTKWLQLLLVNLLVAGYAFVDAPRHRLRRWLWVSLAFTCGAFGWVAYLLAVISSKYDSGEQPRRTWCKCGYDLRGNMSGVCSECGEAVRSSVGQGERG